MQMCLNVHANASNFLNDDEEEEEEEVMVGAVLVE